MADRSDDSPGNSRAHQTSWGRIYASVIGFTALVILLLLWFSQHYSG